MNKLYEAGQKVRERIYNLADSEGKLNFSDLDMIEETVREVCAEYARRIIPSYKKSPNEVKAMLNNLQAYAEYLQEHFCSIGYNSCIYNILNRIDQDILSLNEKNI
jgi:hypothetical protein